MTPQHLFKIVTAVNAIVDLRTGNGLTEGELSDWESAINFLASTELWDKITEEKS